MIRLTIIAMSGSRQCLFTGAISVSSAHKVPLLGPLNEPYNEAVGIPKLDVMTINEAFSPGYRLAIIATDERCESCEVTVGSDEIGAIFLHRLIGGFNSPLRSFATSDERSGSPPSQSLQRNLRPPVLTNINRMGLRHLWQIGGGVFLGMNA